MHEKINCSGLMIYGMRPLIWIFLLFSVSIASAGQYDKAIDRTAFSVFSGDINGDGKVDILVRAKPRVVVVPGGDDDIIIVLPLPSLTPSFLLTSNAGTYSLIPNPDPAILNNPVWQPNGYDIIKGDVLGNGAGSLLLKTRAAGAPSFVIAMSANDGGLHFIQELNQSVVGVDLGGSGVTSKLVDVNSDRRTDLVVSVDNRITVVLQADENGIFRRESATELSAIWGGFLASLANNDGSGALKYLVEDSRDKYGRTLTYMGESIKKIPASLSPIKFVKIGDNYAIGLTYQTVRDRAVMRFVNFIYLNNTWNVIEF